MTPRPGIRIGLAAGGALTVAGLVVAQQSVVDTVHNLSATGPGEVRATSEPEICIFCHTPHNASPVQPLWNRNLPLTTYNVYSSSALDALPGQPTGSSKLCLSCHDGTIALGSVLSRDQAIAMADGITTLPPGGSNLGTDLSDDHPISFRYDAALAFDDGHLVDPGGLPPHLRLDGNQELQCSTCHDAHDNTFGMFLTMGNENAALCRSCHTIGTTTIIAHDDCIGCHRSHTAPSGAFLLRAEAVTPTCLDCHDGRVPNAADIGSLLTAFSVHDTARPGDWQLDRRDDRHDAFSSHVSCTDCHDPHSMETGTASAPAVHPSFGRIAGVGASGATVEAAAYEYEVCFKCHADDAVETNPPISRQIVQSNTRLEFALSAVSFHPVEGPGRNAEVPSLKSPWDESSVMYCSDCHGSSTSKLAGGSGPDGVHGSDEPPMLVARYETTDFTPESSSAYALCYRCHERDGVDGILSDRSFPHRLHLEDNISCSACHDAHGISSVQGSPSGNSHLINFDTTVVFPEPGSGLLRFTDLGTFAGSCTLTCHGVGHAAMSYGPG